MSNEIDVKIKADASGVKPGTDAAAAAVASASSKMRSEFDALHQNASGALSKISTAMSMFASVMAGGVIGKQFIELGKAVTDYADNNDRAAQKAGINVQSMQELAFAAHMADIEFSSLSTAMVKLNKNINDAQNGVPGAVAAFEAVGVSAADIAEKSPDKILEIIADRFAKTEDSASKTAVAVALFGKAGADMIPMLNKGSDAMHEARAAAHEYGLVLSDEVMQAATDLDDSMKELGSANEGLKLQISAGMLPIMASFTNALKDSAKEGGGMNAMADALAVDMKYLAIACSYVAEGFLAIGKEIAYAAAIIPAFKEGGVDGVKRLTAVVKEDLLEQKKAFQAFRDGVEKPVKITKPEQEKPDEPKEKIQFNAKESAQGSDGRLSAWKGELEQKKQAEGAFFKDSVAADLAYWQEKLSHVTGSGEKDIALRQHIESEIYNLKKQAAVQARALDEETESQKLKLAQGAIEAKREQLSALHDLGKISDEQYLVELQQTADQEYQLERDLMEKKAALYEGDALAKMKVLDQMAVMEQKHALALQKTTNQMAMQHKKNVEQMLQPVQQAVSHSVQGIVMGTTTAKKAMQNMLKSMLAETIDFLTKKAIKWVATEHVQTAATAMGTAERGALDEAASVKSMMMSGQAALKNIMNNAWTAMSGAYSAIAAIPYVGPFLAPVAAGVAFAGVASMAGNIMSAEGGYDIAAGINPITQLHEKEMVLPAKHAEVIRNMADSGGGGGGAIHMHVHTQSTADFQKFLKKNSHTMAPALRQAARNFTQK
jgi:hypothetical protein